MARKTLPIKASARAVKAATRSSIESSFTEVVDLIQQSRHRAYQAVNAEMIDLYWRVGEAISRRVDSEAWGKGTVASLAAFIQRTQCGRRGERVAIWPV